MVACPETLPGDRFQAYGIKEDLLDGTYVQGEFVGQVTLDRVEVVADRVDQAIRAGCSGAGVWNCRRYGLAGMIVEMQNETQGRVIPVETLQLVWPITGQTVTGKEAASAGSSRLDFSLLARRLSSLLYTFDRELQEADFDMALETSWKQQRPVVCAILGIADDLPILCRDRCLRVRLRDLLERLELGGRLPNLKHIRWPGRKAPNALARLQQQVKIELRAADSSAGKIRKAYNDGVVPFVFHSDIRNLDFDLSDGDVLVQWIKFWDEVGSEPLNKPLAVFLLLELDGQTQQRVGLTPYFVDNFFAVPQSNAHALNRLNAFSREAVVDWLREKANELALSDDDFALSLLPKVRIGLDAMDLRLAVLEKWITTTLADATVP